MENKKDRIENGCVYQITGSRNENCLSNGNSWEESKVRSELELAEEQERKTLEEIKDVSFLNGNVNLKVEKRRVE